MPLTLAPQDKQPPPQKDDDASLVTTNTILDTSREPESKKPLNSEFSAFDFNFSTSDSGFLMFSAYVAATPTS